MQILTKLSSRHASLIRNERMVTYWTGNGWHTVKEADALMEDRSVGVIWDNERRAWVVPERMTRTERSW